MFRVAPVRNVIAPVVTGLAVLFAVSACYVKDLDYPSDWPELATYDNVEKRLEGTYSCLGLVSTIDGWPRGYLYRLLAIETPHPVECEWAEFVLIENGILLHYLDKDAIVLRHRLVRFEDYFIENGWIKLKEISSWHSDAGVVVHGSVEAWLSVNSEGQLTVMNRSSGAGLVLLIPMGGVATEWGRFDRLD